MKHDILLTALMTISMGTLDKEPPFHDASADELIKFAARKIAEFNSANLQEQAPEDRKAIDCIHKKNCKWLRDNDGCLFGCSDFTPSAVEVRAREIVHKYCKVGTPVDDIVKILTQE